MSDLFLNMKCQYFEEILAGTKPEEYRLQTDYWCKRIMRGDYDRIILMKGYPKGGGVEGKTKLTLKWRGYKVGWITHPHFGDRPVQVFKIDVTERWA